MKTPNIGLTLQPNAYWDGNPNFEFEITGRNGSNYGSNPDIERSASGWSIF